MNEKSNGSNAPPLIGSPAMRGMAISIQFPRVDEMKLSGPSLQQSNDALSGSLSPSSPPEKLFSNVDGSGMGYVSNIVLGASSSSSSSSEYGFGDKFLKRTISDESDSFDQEERISLLKHMSRSSSRNHSEEQGFAYQPNSTSNEGQKIAKGNNIVSIFMFALINAAISVPSLIGYANVIFRDPVYADHMDQFAALVIL